MYKYTMNIYKIIIQSKNGRVYENHSASDYKNDCVYDRHFSNDF